MGTDGRDRRWPRASDAPGPKARPDEDDDLDTRRTNPVPVLPLVVAERLRPQKTFRALAAALGLPNDDVRTLLLQAMHDPDGVPETVTASDLVTMGPSLLRAMETFLPEAERRGAQARVEALLKGMEGR
jgi:hypothetical protein